LAVIIAAKPLEFIRSNWRGFPETEINLENTADLVGKSRKNVANRGITEKTLIKTVYFFEPDSKVRVTYEYALDR
jgi:hypothetical protein